MLRRILHCKGHIELTAYRHYAERYEPRWDIRIHELPLHVRRQIEIRIEYVDFVVMEIRCVQEGRTIHRPQREALIDGMAGAVLDTVVVCRDGGRPAVHGPRCDRPALTSKQEQSSFLTFARGDEETAAAIVDLPRRVGGSAGSRSGDRDSRARRAGHFLRFNVTRTTVERREVAIVVGDPEWQPGRHRDSPRILQVSVHRFG